MIVKTSNAAKHSSNRSSFGSLNRESAMTNFRFCPPDKNLAFISLTFSNSNFVRRKSIFSFLKLILSITISLIAFKLS